MHYDPYESLASKKRRWLSNICMVIIGLLMVGGILALIFRDTENPKYKFEQLKLDSFTLEQLDGDKPEFEVLRDNLSVKNQTVFDDTFKQSYPTVSSLLSMDSSVYNANKPFVSVGGGYITVAQCVISNQTDCRDLAVTMIGLRGAVDENRLILNVSDIHEYTVRYNTRDSSVPLTYLTDGNGTRMDIFKIGIDVKNDGLESSSYRLKINGSFDEDRAKARLYHQIIFDPINNSYHHPKIDTKKDSTRISISPTEAVTDKKGHKCSPYEINLNGNIFYLFESVDFEYTTDNPEQTEITIEFN